MSQALGAAIAGLTRLLAELPANRHELVLPAISILAEQLANPELPEARLQQLAKLELQLKEYEPSERARIIRERMSLTKSSYYRLRAAAAETGLIS